MCNALPAVAGSAAEGTRQSTKVMPRHQHIHRSKIEDVNLQDSSSTHPQLCTVIYVLHFAPTHGSCVHTDSVRVCVCEYSLSLAYCN